jgi:hypothetical protein
VILAILIGASLHGILGALIANPHAPAIQAVVPDYWAFSERNLGAIAARAATNLDEAATEDATEPAG